MGKVLDAVAIGRFHRYGFHAPVTVASREAALRMRGHLETYENAHGGPLKGSVRFKSHLLFKWLADFIRSPRVLDPVEDIIGPDIMVWSTDWWLKEANSPSFVSWHQDSQYWGLDSEKLVTLWVALSRSNVASGCMRYLPGSHVGPDLPHRETYHDDNLLTRGQEITEGIDETRAVNVELEPGEGSIFAFRIAHASHPNRSHDRRIGLAIRFIPPTHARSGPITTAWRSCAASTPTATSSSNPNRSATSTRPRWSSTGGRRRSAGRSSTTAPSGRRTGPEPAPKSASAVHPAPLHGSPERLQNAGICPRAFPPNDGRNVPDSCTNGAQRTISVPIGTCPIPHETDSASFPHHPGRWHGPCSTKPPNDSVPRMDGFTPVILRRRHSDGLREDDDGSDPGACGARAGYGNNGRERATPTPEIPRG